MPEFGFRSGMAPAIPLPMYNARPLPEDVTKLLTTGRVARCIAALWSGPDYGLAVFNARYPGWGVYRPH